MSDPNPEDRPAPRRETDRWLEPGKTNLQVIYVLYLAGFAVAVTPIVGIVLAHINAGKAGGWIETHYTWAIRTFWIGLLYSFISFILAFVLIGFLLMLLVAVWFVVRIVIGLQKVSNEEPIANPQSWVL